MASDGACQRAIQPYAEVRPKALLELRHSPREEQPDVIGRTRRIHPGKPLPQVGAVPLDSCEQDFGVVPLKLSQFETIGYRAPKHSCLPRWFHLPIELPPHSPPQDSPPTLRSRVLTLCFLLRASSYPKKQKVGPVGNKKTCGHSPPASNLFLPPIDWAAPRQLLSGEIFPALLTRGTTA